MFRKLIAGVGETILKKDPNPRLVYMATKRRAALPGVKHFAEEATKARGGSPVLAHAKIDTTKGWEPHEFTAWAREKGLSREDFLDAVADLDSGAKGKERGQLWEMLQRGVGSWRNADPTTTVKPAFYKSIAAGAEKVRP